MEDLTLQQALYQNDNFMIVRKGCPFCAEASRMLHYKKIKITEYDKDEYTKLKEEAQEKYKHRTFPLIVLDKQFVGGCSDLKKKSDIE
ncbi:glutaredoxin [Vairimorpha ceranae]|uniref:Glutaredoxin n=1 Tax=Vairimorpha ceranae TaxID=40302 RepID=A0A0F9WJ82_9MICR|nr:glutaredoxin [Vairimorpha ceranae]KAF5141830.1 hypothetical protein G9O61_00g001130 [Vairimorpha ceranae]KKO76600.1 glutaredoxin [Vairimorpha ceranae]